MKVVGLLACCVFAVAIHFSNGAAVEPKAGGKSMVCYYGSWAVYRPGNGKFDVEQIDPFLCTHIIYGFTGLGTDNTMIPLDPWNDLYDNWGKGAFLRFTGLKQQNPNLKALIAIGGWNEGSEKYSRMVSDPAKRATFVNSVVNFIKKYNFDGLDFDWEYPANRGGLPSDKQNYISMIRELKNAFTPYGWLLTAAVSPGKSTIDSAYDIPALAGILDQVHVMNYDYHGSWETYTGLNAPLYANPNYDLTMDNQFLNANWTIYYWLSNGVPPSKIIMGMPLYGRGFQLDNSAKNGFYASAANPIPAGPYTQQAGTWGYNEICEKFKADGTWTVVRDSCYQTPYAYKNNLWIGYDDEQSLRNKGKYIAAMNLGGALTWSIETDDFRGYCHGTPFILTKSIVEAMNGPTNLMPTNPCASGSPPPPTPPPIDTTTKSTTIQITTPNKVTTTTTATPSTTTTKISTNPTPTITSTPPSTPSCTCAIPTGTPAPPVTTTQASSGGTTSEPNSVCKKEGLNADPNDCGIFYQCIAQASNGWLVYTQHCAAGTVFNAKIDVCDFPQKVPGCENYYG
ncbi:acidic mammalian chitinase-like isoform X1 [Daphnia pulex]|uniref:acidic mammalian chitinase-like isoform X1 n=1 Tax=Daphnia pulex TaxID=6669 RepID=UPI001EDD8ED5|nr:acidic mammalian chitinase-like isoform X1 [Daphnia pulex]